MRKIWTLFLSALLLCAITGNAFASTTGFETVGNAQLFVEQLGYDVELNEKPTETSESFNIIENGIVKSNVEVTVGGDGEIIYDIVQGNITDELLIKKDGSMYIDGSLITVTETINGKTEKKPLIANYEKMNPGAMTRAQRNEFTTICPYGEDEDYDDPDAEYVGRVLDFGMNTFDTLTDLSFGAVVAVAISLSMPTGLSAITVGTIGFLVAFGLDNVLDQLQELTPLGKTSSVKTMRTVHQEKGYNVTPNMSVARHRAMFFATDHYTGALPNWDGEYVRIAYEVFTY